MFRNGYFFRLVFTETNFLVTLRLLYSDLSSFGRECPDLDFFDLGILTTPLSASNTLIFSARSEVSFFAALGGRMIVCSPKRI